MTATPPPPLKSPIVEPSKDVNGEITMSWVEFFNSLFEGDAGERWTPVWSGLTETGGAAAIDAIVARINQNLVIFAITIVPATSVSATAGTTYATGLPVAFELDTACFAVAGGLGATPGHVVAADGRIYIPSLAAVTVPITIIGIGFAR